MSIITKTLLSLNNITDVLVTSTVIAKDWSELAHATSDASIDAIRKEASLPARKKPRAKKTTK